MNDDKRPVPGPETAPASGLAAGLDRLIAGLGRISTVGCWLGGGALAVFALGTGGEVLARRFLGMSLGGMDEIGGYVLAIVAAVAFTETLLARGHIRIDILRGQLPGKLREIMDLIAMLSLIVFFGLVLWYGHALLARNWGLGARSMTPLAVPLWIPQVLWVLALALFWITSCLLFLRGLIAFATGENARLAALIGAKATEEEIEDERALSAAAETAR